MRLNFVVLAFVGVVLLSCSTVNEDYSTAATELCECMKESGYDANDATNTKTNIGLCLLDAKVDLRNPQMVVEIEKSCPEIKDKFVEFVEGM